MRETFVSCTELPLSLTYYPKTNFFVLNAHLKAVDLVLTLGRVTFLLLLFKTVQNGPPSFVGLNIYTQFCLRFYSDGETDSSVTPKFVNGKL